MLRNKLLETRCKDKDVFKFVNRSYEKKQNISIHYLIQYIKTIGYQSNRCHKIQKKNIKIIKDHKSQKNCF